MRDAYDILVIGGGHAGAEAAHAAARLGADTALVTMSLEAIGRMSCNPAVGGLGKGQMVCEIDALGGLMGRAIDAAGIQFRLLNRSKGPAVQAPRAQADRRLYAAEVLRLLKETDHLTLVEGSVEGINTKPARHGPEVTGVRLSDGRSLEARAVIVAAGTFLRGLMHCGPTRTPGGRLGEQPANALSRALADLGLALGRLKTGTPPRLYRDTINFRALAEQPGDPDPQPFSFMTDRIDCPQACCWIANTNPQTHCIIRDNLHLAPMYSGQIKSRGPRYCPSIEDKVVRFADKPGHQIFLEPEGLDDERVYCNGISTSLPAEVQDALVRSIVGLESARIAQHGYAVEYDYVPTTHIRASLETKRVSGLFLAGQVNGTSGYEEAAAQGLLAGINAVCKINNTEPLVLGRDQAYIGVMIDDLVTRPPDEPYRMFTSRAEYRMTLRCDNADARLSPIGRRIGLVDDQRWARYEAIHRQSAQAEALLASVRCNGTTALDLLRRPEVTLRALIDEWPALSDLHEFGDGALRRVEIATKYAGYLKRQERQIERCRSLESKGIPGGFDYWSLSGLRTEAKERLSAVGPRSLGQASRIPGISPADITVLWVALQRSRRV
jgi:tRNA uridine 5-carboxymethylaminomethyl modification enzyme